MRQSIAVHHEDLRRRDHFRKQVNCGAQAAQSHAHPMDAWRIVSGHDALLVSVDLIQAVAHDRAKSVFDRITFVRH